MKDLQLQTMLQNGNSTRLLVEPELREKMLTAVSYLAKQMINNGLNMCQQDYDHEHFVEDYKTLVAIYKLLHKDGDDSYWYINLEKIDRILAAESEDELYDILL